MPLSVSLDDKTMLALAAISYRGFGKQSEAEIAEDLRPWLPKLADHGLGRWVLSWGPAEFRVETSLFDDSMVYVARRIDLPAGVPPRYAVVVRGTNPVSAFDWIFGDLFVQLRVPWDAKRPATGNLSASTALGLAIIQHLRAQEPPSATGNLVRTASRVAGAVKRFADVVPELLPEALLGGRSSFDDDALLARIEALTRRSVGGFRENALDALGEIFGAARPGRETVDRMIFERLLAEIAATPDPGQSLLQFLHGLPARSRVAVTGHSKGGALAVATALWLDEVWAANTGRTIECFSFAGPTAGDEAFAAYYDSCLAGRTRSVVNARDVVPHAWAQSDLLRVRKFYPLLAPAISALAESVQSQRYTHVGGDVIQFDLGAGPRIGTVAEIIHQHLDAYLMAAMFSGPDWNAESIFLG